MYSIHSNDKSGRQDIVSSHFALFLNGAKKDKKYERWFKDFLLGQSKVYYEDAMLIKQLLEEQAPEYKDWFEKMLVLL